MGRYFRIFSTFAKYSTIHHSRQKKSVFRCSVPLFVQIDAERRILLPHQRRQTRTCGYVHLRPRRAFDALLFFRFFPLPCSSSDAAAPASIAAAVISERVGSSSPPAKKPITCTTSHEEATQANVIIIRLLVLPLPTQHPANAASDAAISAAASILSSPTVPFSISAAVAASNTSSDTQHTRAPSAHFFTYQTVDTVCSTEKPPLHSPT